MTTLGATFEDVYRERHPLLAAKVGFGFHDVMNLPEDRLRSIAKVAREFQAEQQARRPGRRPRSRR